MKRILLADDNAHLRGALRLLLKTRFDIALILEACDMEHVLAQVQEARPDYIFLDWELPGHPSRNRVAVLRSLVPGLKVIAFSVHQESKESALKEGVEAFVCKGDSPLVVLNSLQKLFQRTPNQG